MKASAEACANIALVKYWGKRDAALNLPAAGSLSLTLDGLVTRTTVTFGEAACDTLVLGGEPRTGSMLGKAKAVLDLVRQRAGIDHPALITSENSFPTGAGLASSASGLAALAGAAAAAAGLSLSPTELSVIARQGSGSACRSVFGGFALWRPGTRDDGLDSHAVPLFAADHWDLRVVVVLLCDRPKPVGSTEGMLHTAATSPFFEPYLDRVPHDLDACREAVRDRDFDGLRRVAERSCLRMHATMMAADPALVYLQPKSWSVIAAVRAMRDHGLPALFTADAGPNIKVFCPAAVVDEVTARLRAVEGVTDLMVARPGPGLRVSEG